MSTLHIPTADGTPPSASCPHTPEVTNTSSAHQNQAPTPFKPRSPRNQLREQKQASPSCEEGRTLSLTRSYAEGGLALIAPDPLRVCLSMRDSVRPSPKALSYFCSSRIRLISACTARSWL